VSTWYFLVRFACPGCGQRFAVEKRQVARHDHVTCQRCNADLLLTPRGQSVAAVPDANTGERAHVVEIAI
jgi:DNA-directed RNA polymerase subunit RPC12/RpoP